MSVSVPSVDTSKINCSRFYYEWKGHQIQDINRFRSITLEQRPGKPIVYLAGDSSLDNKYWVHPQDRIRGAVPEIYESALDRPNPKHDVAFWLNHFLGDRATCINTAVEESMLRDRDEQLLPHDQFIRDNIRPEDVLIVSVGANDIALRPLPSTIIHMLQLAWLTPCSMIKKGAAWSLPYFREMFGPKVQRYIEALTMYTKPRAIIVCMIYFPLEFGLGQTSWADLQLRALGYNTWPKQLQTAIHSIYKSATKKIRIDGTQILPCALYEVLDGKDVDDYTARVEPSREGGRKIATKFVQLLEDVIP
jgi:hypothetical protein